MLFETIAKIQSQPQSIPFPRSPMRVLMFTDESHSKINLYLLGDLKSDDHGSTPSEQAFDLHELMKAILNVSREFSENQINISRMIKQTNLLWELSKSKRLQPGVSHEQDTIILSHLRNALSGEILNSDPIIEEFIRIWNFLATLKPIESKNHSNEQPPIFSPLLDYPEFIRLFCAELLDKSPIKHSKSYTQNLAQLASAPAVAAESLAPSNSLSLIMMQSKLISPYVYSDFRTDAAHLTETFVEIETRRDPDKNKTQFELHRNRFIAQTQLQKDIDRRDRSRSPIPPFNQQKPAEDINSTTEKDDQYAFGM